MKKSLYLGFALVMAMSVVFFACKDDDEKSDEETFTDVKASYSLPSTTEAAKVNANLSIDSAQKSNKTGIITIKLAGSTVAVDSATKIAIPANSDVYYDMFDDKDAESATDLLKTDAIAQGFSAFVITGVVDLTKEGHIKQYNQGLNAWKTPITSVTFDYGSDDVYREKDYDANTYAPASLGGFDIVLWGGAKSKVITLYVTQPKSGDTVTYKIDYSAVDIKKPATP
ncbi:MAG: hypothetical protein LBQ77_03600 [Treponema sp.]|jgi:hypothetical protein|nr:hypothetical protein [Treponema sp.]